MTWHVYRLDDSLAPVEELGRVRSIQIDRSATEDAPLLESCSVKFDADVMPWAGGWHRIERHDCGGRTSFGVFLLSAASSTISGGIATVTASGRSVLSDAADSKVEIGSYCRAGSDAAAEAAALLAGCGSGVMVNGSAQLKRNIVYDDGSSRLSAAWRLLDEVGWRIRLDGSGGVHVEPLPTVPSLRITAANPGGVRSEVEVGDGIGYKRTVGDDVERPLDVVAVVLPRFGVDVEEQLVSQSITAGTSAESSEKLGRRAIEWQ